MEFSPQIPLLTLVQVMIIAVILVSSVKYIRRAFFAPLASVPGPPLARISSLWSLYHVVRRDKFYAVHDAFERYGPVVRVSPGTVAVGDPRYLKDLYMAKLDKHPAYAGFTTNHGIPNAFSALTTAEAQGKRRGMLPHYATANLVQWQDVLDEHLRELVVCLEKNGEDVDILSLGAHALIDILGEVILDTRIGAVPSFSNGTPCSLVRTINLWPKRGTLKGQMGPVLWALAERVPIGWWQELVNSDARLAEFVAPLVHAALANSDTPSRPCLIHRLAASKDNHTGQAWEVEHIVSECVDHFLAGTETTSTTFAYLMYRLSVQSDVQQSLQRELDDHMHTGDELLSVNEAARLPLLNAVVKEALRLFAPVPGPLDRIVPPEGMQVGDHYLAPGTYVGMQAYSCHRDREIWGDDAQDFRPSRWLDASPEMTAAFVPFSIGSRNCPGMNIAYTDLRLLTATIARNFEITASSQTTPESMRMLDMTAISPVSGEVRLRFSSRRR